MVELPLFVRLIPKNLGEFKGEIETKVGLGRGRAMAGATAPEIGAMTEVAEEVGEHKKISLGMLGKMGAMLGGIGLIIKSIMSLKPLIAIFDMISKIISLFFLPFVMMAYKLLRPVLIFLLRLMVMWYKFWQDPIGNISQAISGIFEGAKNIGEWLKGLITPENLIRFMFPIIPITEILFRLFGKEVDIGHLIWTKLLEFWKTTKDFGAWIWDKLIGIWNWTKDFGGWLWEKLQTIWNWAFDFGGWLWEQLITIWVWHYNLAKWLWDVVTKSLSKGIDLLESFGHWIWDSITETILKGLDVLSNLGRAIYDWVKDKIFGMGGAISDWIGGAVDWTKKATGLDDFIISGGRVYKTNPKDTIVGTKNGAGTNINNIHIHVTGFMDDDLIPVLVDKISDELNRRTRW